MHGTMPSNSQAGTRHCEFGGSEETKFTHLARTLQYLPDCDCGGRLSLCFQQISDRDSILFSLGLFMKVELLSLIEYK